MTVTFKGTRVTGMLDQRTESPLAALEKYRPPSVEDAPEEAEYGQHYTHPNGGPGDHSPRAGLLEYCHGVRTALHASYPFRGSADVVSTIAYNADAHIYILDANIYIFNTNIPSALDLIEQFGYVESEALSPGGRENFAFVKAFDVLSASALRSVWSQKSCDWGWSGRAKVDVPKGFSTLAKVVFVTDLTGSWCMKVHSIQDI
ncbi:hypothetical protein ACKVV1_003431 [Pyricularia oryzae]